MVESLPDGQSSFAAYRSPDRYLPAGVYVASEVVEELPSFEGEEEGVPLEALSEEPAFKIPVFEDEPEEEVEGPIAYKDGLYRVEDVYERRNLPLDAELKTLVNAVLHPEPKNGSSKQGAGSLAP
jgi:hypothetical protein